jgi:hypothetical protein
MYFAHYPEYFDLITNPMNRSIYLLGWFEGETVRSWADAILSTIGTTRESPLLTDWPRLLQTAAILWGPINEELEARNRLRDLKQEQTVSAYHAKFLRYAITSRYNEAALVDSFYRGLKESIKNMMVNIQRPTTIEEMLTSALDFESRILERAKERTYTETIRPRSTGGTTSIKATRLPPEERAKRMKEGRCFGCNQTGHRVRECPKKTQIKAAKEKETSKETIETKEETEKEEKDF